MFAVMKQLKQLQRKPRKKESEASTGFEPMASMIPVCCSTNWAMKPHWKHVKYEFNLYPLWLCMILYTYNCCAVVASVHVLCSLSEFAFMLTKFHPKFGAKSLQHKNHDTFKQMVCQESPLHRFCKIILCKWRYCFVMKANKCSLWYNVLFVYF